MTRTATTSMPCNLDTIIALAIADALHNGGGYRTAVAGKVSLIDVTNLQAASGTTAAICLTALEELLRLQGHAA